MSILNYLIIFTFYVNRGIIKVVQKKIEMRITNKFCISSVRSDIEATVRLLTQFITLQVLDAL